MIYNFEEKKIITLEYGRGTIICHAGLAEKFTEQTPKYMLEIWYLQNNYGIAHLIVGIGIDSDFNDVIENEIERMMSSRYIPDAVYNIDADIDYYENVVCWNPSLMNQITRTKTEVAEEIEDDNTPTNFLSSLN